MNIDIFLTILFVLTVFYSIVGYASSRKTITFDDFFLSHKNLGIISLTFMLISTQLGSGLILGTAAQSYNIGLWGILYSVGISTGFLLLACGFAGRLQSLKVTTTAQIFEVYYHSQKLKIFASIISIITLSGILIAQVIASHQLFMSIGIPDAAWLVGLWVLLIGYSMLAGVRSTLYISILQIIFVISSLSVILYYALPTDGLAIMTVPMLKKMQWYYFNKNQSITLLIPIVFSSACYVVIGQDVAQKFFAAKSKMTAVIAAFFSAIILTFIGLIPLYFGLLAKMQSIPASLQINPFLAIIEKTQSQSTHALFLATLIVAIALTTGSLLRAIHGHIRQDFAYLFPHKRVQSSKKITLAIGFIATILSFFVPQDIIFILESSYNLSIGLLFVPIFMVYCTKNVRQGGAIAAITCGCLSLIGVQLYIPISIWQTIIPVLLSLLGYTIGAILAEK